MSDIELYIAVTGSISERQGGHVVMLFRSLPIVINRVVIFSWWSEIVLFEAVLCVSRERPGKTAFD